LYAKYDLLDRLHAYKVRPVPNLPPGKYETGTQNHEGIVCHHALSRTKACLGTGVYRFNEQRR
jgi:hypothetical protein